MQLRPSESEVQSLNELGFESTKIDGIEVFRLKDHADTLRYFNGKYRVLFCDEHGRVCGGIAGEFTLADLRSTYTKQ